ncbi:unnamed protein product, partial [Mesorhabditis belari]|uniref:MIF4G domain-containing protein n=1 Tax=Mesorhabditis belari TaxID=2138241 RepID=A0AAF3EG08_9BILA
MQIKQRPFMEEELIRIEGNLLIFDEEVVLRRALNAWKKCDEKTVYNEIIALTNKITKNYFDEQKNEFIAHVEKIDEEKVEKIVGIIFERAMEEPEFCKLYVQLCQAQISADHQKAETSKFAEILITKTQRLFDFLFGEDSKNEINGPTQIEILLKEKEKMEQSLKSSRSRESSASLAEIEVKLKWKQNGFINLIGQLYLAKIVNPRIVNYCLKKMMQQLKKPTEDEEIDWRQEKVEMSILGFCSLLQLVAEDLVKNSTTNEIETLRFLLDFLYENRQRTVNRIRFSIMDTHETTAPMLSRI